MKLDEHDAQWLSSFAMRAKRGKNDSSAYVLVRAKRRGRWIEYRLHRLIMGARCGEIVDHINGDTLDNQRSNLRFCTAAQNAWNRRAAGTTMHSSGKWQAAITCCGKHYHLGLFATQEDASNAYRRKAAELFGEYAAVAGRVR